LRVDPGLRGGRAAPDRRPDAAPAGQRDPPPRPRGDPVLHGHPGARRRTGHHAALMFRVIGADPVLPGRFLVGTAAAECVGSTTLAAAELFRARGGEPGEVTVDVRHAAHAFRSERYLRLNGEPVGDLWTPVSGDYQGADGWLRIHANFPHHA